VIAGLGWEPCGGESREWIIRFIGWRGGWAVRWLSIRSRRALGMAGDFVVFGRTTLAMVVRMSRTVRPGA